MGQARTGVGAWCCRRLRFASRTRRARRAERGRRREQVRASIDARAQLARVDVQRRSSLPAAGARCRAARLAAREPQAGDGERHPHGARWRPRRFSVRRHEDGQVPASRSRSTTPRSTTCRSWPAIAGIDADVKFDGHAAGDRRATRGRMFGAQFGPDQGGDPESSAAGAAADGRRARPRGRRRNSCASSRKSPVAGWIGHVTDDAQATGNGKLTLKLQMPLGTATARRSTGDYQFLRKRAALSRRAGAGAGQRIARVHRSRRARAATLPCETLRRAREDRGREYGRRRAHQRRRARPTSPVSGASSRCRSWSACPAPPIGSSSSPRVARGVPTGRWTAR